MKTLIVIVLLSLSGCGHYVSDKQWNDRNLITILEREGLV